MRNLVRELDTLVAQRGWRAVTRTTPTERSATRSSPWGLSRPAPHPCPASARPPPRPPGRRARRARRRGRLPGVERQRVCRLPPGSRVVGVEPHIGRDGVGVKFEEILVVTEDDAYWLDDHLLHTQRWAAAGYSITPLGAA